MLVFIYGGSGSGKSVYAENYSRDFKEKNRYYLATMKVSDEESVKRVEKHRSQRQGLSFSTIELPVDIFKASNALSEYREDNLILLECMSNLVANEMFRDGDFLSLEEVVAKVLKDIDTLNNKASTLIIVSNNIFEDGIAYDSYTKEYMRALGRINKSLAKQADKIIEVVVGIGIEHENT